MSALSDNTAMHQPSLESAPMKRAPLDRLRTSISIVLFLLSFYVAYRYGMSFSDATASPFWFPDSVLLCALLTADRRYWWLMLLATLPIRLTVAVPEDASLVFLIGVYVNDCAKAVVGALFVRRYLIEPTCFRSIREFSFYSLVVVLLIPTISALGGAASRELSGHEYWRSWTQWFLGDASAALILTPAIFYWALRPKGLRNALQGRLLEFAVMCAGLTVSTWFAFEQSEIIEPWIYDSRFFFSLIFLIWAAIRFGMTGATAAMVLYTVFAVHSALSTIRTLAASPAEIALELQTFLLLRAAPLYLIGVLIDQMRHVEKSLRESEERYRDIVQSQNHFVCRFQTDFKLTFINEAYGRFLARPRTESTGGSLLELMPDNSRHTISQRIEDAIGNRKATEWECEIPMGAEQNIWQRWNCHAIYDSQGSVIELQAVGHDISDQKRLEEANRQLTQAARLITVGELTAVVAHEIKQPLAAIRMNAETAQLLLESPQPPLDELRSIADDILKAGVHADEVIRTIRALANKRDIQLGPINLNEIVEKVRHLAMGDAQRRRVQIRTQLAANLPMVRGDPVSLQQVLINLIVNSMDALEPMQPAQRQLTVETKAHAEGAEVIVSDTGEGIPPEKMTRLFDSFFTTKSDGVGLGLSIARSIVQIHKGKIWAESLTSGGAAFHFTVQYAGD